MQPHTLCRFHAESSMSSRHMSVFSVRLRKFLASDTREMAKECGAAQLSVMSKLLECMDDLAC